MPGDGSEDVISVILHEYDSLRAEIVSRTEALFQLIGFLGLAATIFGVTGLNVAARVVLIVSTLLIVGIVWLFFGLAIKRCAVRLREIEDQVNRRLGEPVLVWESKRLPRDRFPYFLFR